MRRTAIRWMVIALACVLAGSAAAQTAPEWIRMAVEAHGGAAALESWSDQTIEADATLFFGTTRVEGEMTVHVREGRMLRREGLFSFGGTPFAYSDGSTGKSAWRNMRSRVYDFPVDNFDTWLRHRPDILLRAANAGDADLTFAGEFESDDGKRVRIDFVEEGQLTQIVIDAETHRVRALEYKAMENNGDGKKEEAFVKRVFGDYTTETGTPFPGLIEEYSDGVQSTALRVRSATFGKAPEIALFAKPIQDEEAKEWGDQLAD